MKVLHINCNYFGSNAVHRNMISEMNKIKDIENYVFCPVTKNVSDGTSDKIVASKCITKFDRIAFHYKSRKIKNSLLKTFDINQMDIIHAYTLFTDGNVAYNINKKFNIPYVVAIRNTDVFDFFRKMPHLRRRGISIMLNAKYVFFLSESYKNIVFKKYVPKKYRNDIMEKTIIMPNGIDSFWLDNLYDNDNNVLDKLKRINKKELSLIYVGDINYNKNILNTCKAINILKNEKWEIDFRVAGKIRNDKIYNSVKENFTYLGVLRKEELVSQYREADIFVMPSFKETFGMSYIEAISQGLPVIYSKEQGFDKQFEEGVVGYHVDPNNPVEIKDAILKVLSNYATISKNIAKNAQRFSWKTLSNKYYKLYMEIMDKF